MTNPASLRAQATYWGQQSIDFLYYARRNQRLPLIGWGDFETAALAWSRRRQLHRAIAQLRTMQATARRGQ